MPRIKPNKPYPEFPLFAHASGQWAKTILGKHVYFGKWDDWQAALEKYNSERDYLYAGQAPPTTYTTLADILNAFVDSKQQLLDLDRIGTRAFTEYVEITDIIAATINKNRPIESIGTEDLGKLWAVLGKGKGGNPITPPRHKIKLGMARMVFNYANEELNQSIRYKKALRSPSVKVIRLAKAEVGEKLFEAKEIRDLIAIAKPQLKAMILLGINCGFGNEDCATLPIDKLDLVGGWHFYHRPKTGVMRHCKLWTETVKALKQVIEHRPQPKNKADDGLVFITKYGQPWRDVKTEKNSPISAECRKLTTELGIHRDDITTFYTLRRTCQTIGELANQPKALQYIMGHLPAANDMSAVYRQKTFDSPIHKITDHVRKWLRGSITLR